MRGGGRRRGGRGIGIGRGGRTERRKDGRRERGKEGRRERGNDSQVGESLRHPERTGDDVAPLRAPQSHLPFPRFPSFPLSLFPSFRLCLPPVSPAQVRASRGAPTAVYSSHGSHPSPRGHARLAGGAASLPQLRRPWALAGLVPHAAPRLPDMRAPPGTRRAGIRSSARRCSTLSPPSCCSPPFSSGCWWPPCPTSPGLGSNTAGRAHDTLPGLLLPLLENPLSAFDLIFRPPTAEDFTERSPS